MRPSAMQEVQRSRATPAREHRSQRAAAALVLALALWPRPAGAGEKPCVPEGGTCDPKLECAQDCQPPGTLVLGLSGGEPYGASASLGAVWGASRLVGPARSGLGVLTEIEAGLHAGALRVGPAAVVKAGTRGFKWPILGAALSGVVLRTWGGSDPTPDRTYAGFDVTLTALARLRVGKLWRTGDAAGGTRSFWTWSVGLGF